MLPHAQDLAVQAMLKAYKAADDKWIPIFKQRLEVTEFPVSERQKLVKASAPIWEAWVKDQEAAGRPGRKILDFVKAEVAKVENKK